MFKLGNYTFEFDPNFDPNFVEKIKRLFKKTYEKTDQYISKKIVRGKKIRIIKIHNNRMPVAKYNKGILLLPESVHEETYIHELVHLLHGPTEFFFDFFTEGITQAIASNIAKDIDANRKVYDLQASKNLINGGLETRLDVTYRAYRYLMEPRYFFAAKFWQELEKTRPGFLKEFHLAFNKYLLEGGKSRIMDYIRSPNRDEKKLRETFFLLQEALMLQFLINY